MRTILGFAFSILLVGSSNLAAQAINIPTAESGNHIQHSKEEWTKRGVLDNSMFRYCLHLQDEGYRSLVFTAKKHSTQPWMQSILDAAVSKWSKRGVRNDAMVSYEINNQIDAYLDMEYASKHEGYNSEAFGQCKEEYSSSSPDWNMIRYCYKQKTGD